MSVLSLVLMVLFVVVCALLIFMVSIQDEKQSGLAGIFGGAQGSAFGAQTASVVVKITAVLSVAFFILALCISLIGRISVENRFDSQVNEMAVESAPVSGDEVSSDLALNGSSQALDDEALSDVQGADTTEVI